MKDLLPRKRGVRCDIGNHGGERAYPKGRVIRDRQVVFRWDGPGQPNMAAALANDAVAQLNPARARARSRPETSRGSLIPR